MATRPYQGYPYSNPHVHDAPTVDAVTASRWNNLPRRPVRPIQGNVVYVPEGSPVSRPNEEQTEKKEPNPVIYIDVPDSGSSEVAGPAPEPETVNYDTGSNETLNPSKKSQSEPEPVIYIDVPDGNSSEVSSPTQPEAEPVHETIFYDPFDDRRIDQPKPEAPDSSPGARPRPRPAPAVPRPAPPQTLDLHGAGASGSSSTFSHSNTSNYGHHNDESFQSYPDPPPSYSELHTPQTPQTPPTPIRQTPPTESQTQELPRTVVITHGPELNRPTGELPSPIGLASADRKVVFCHHCGLRVHTLVIWESGFATHVIAFILLCLMLLPLVALVYWINCLKYRNHYCPNCSKKIGHEMPGLCIPMTYTASS